MWGVKDSKTIESYGANVRGVRQVIPRLLELFEAHGLGCSWATTGLLFFEDRDTMLASLPEVRPRYRDQSLSSYAYIHEVGPDEQQDPLHFGLSLIREIMRQPRQEIATHTFGNYYCLEEHDNHEAFWIDLEVALRVAKANGICIRSIVFPRNQVCPEALAVCRDAGVTVYRGSAPGWFNRPGHRSSEGLVQRCARFVNSYVRLVDESSCRATLQDGMADIPASLFLRPYSPRLASLEGLKLNRILSAMRRAAREGSLFHLWFHPHNFGANIEHNFQTMTAIAVEAVRLRSEFDWPSLNMSEAADRAMHAAALTEQMR